MKKIKFVKEELRMLRSMINSMPLMDEDNAYSKKWDKQLEKLQLRVREGDFD